MVWQIVNVAIGGGVAYLLLQGYRSIHRQSSLLGLIVAAGLLLRALAGLALFWISYLGLPIAESLQAGGGFWSVLPDAMAYYRLVSAVDAGALTLDPSLGPLLFVRALIAWMQVVGISPIAGLLLNISLYVLTCVALTRMCEVSGNWRDDLPLIVMLSALSFSPALLIHSTQLLKEDLFISLLVATLIAVVILGEEFIDSAKRASGSRRYAAAALVLVAGTYSIAAVRWYYAALIWASLGFTLLCFAFRQKRGSALRYIAGSALLLTVMWGAYASGAGRFYRPNAADIDHFLTAVGTTPASASGRGGVREEPSPSAVIVGSADAATDLVDSIRAGYESSGGGTKIVPRLRRSFPAGDDGTAPPPSASRLELLMLGIGVVFVPVSALQYLSLVEFSGGEGLLAVTDLDTIFLDVTMVVIATVVWGRRASIQSRAPFVAFAVTLSLVSALLLGYVITNYGTLFRLRVIAAVPIWMLPLAVAATRHRRSLTPDRQCAIGQSAC